MLDESNSAALYNECEAMFSSSSSSTIRTRAWQTASCQLSGCAGQVDRIQWHEIISQLFQTQSTATIVCHNMHVMHAQKSCRRVHQLQSCRLARR
jgi:hypothetical protein